MNKTTLFSIIKWGFLAVYTFFAYHLLFVPFLLDYTILSTVIGWIILLAIALIIPRGSRKQAIVFIALTIFTTTALFQAGSLTSLTKAFYYLLILLAVYFTARHFGKSPRHVVITLLVVTLVIHFTVSRSELRLYNHFVKVWETPALYDGELVDYFPLITHDIDGDGQEEIITFGNVEEERELYLERKRKGLDPDRMPYDIQDDRVFPYVYKWNGKKMERLDNDEIDLEKVKSVIPKDYIGFPYYYWDEDYAIVPQTQKQNIAENTGQFGMSSLFAFQLDVDTIKQYLEDVDGVYSSKESFHFETDIDKITIVDGELIVTKADGEYTMDTTATKVVDLIRMQDGTGIILLGKDLEVWQLDEQGEFHQTHVLTDKEITEVQSSEYMVADITSDDFDEILISSSKSRIIRPLENGEWEVLFASKDESLRFEDFDRLGKEKNPTIIGLSKSYFGRNALRYLTGFTYENNELKQDWKTFESFINVQAADIKGTDDKHLVASVWSGHNIVVFKKHNLPVTSSLIVILVLLTGYALYRRYQAND